MWLRKADFDGAEDVEVDVALGIGHDDAAVGEELVDSEAELAFHFDLPGLSQVEPDAEFEHERIGAEVGKDNLWGGLAEHFRVLMRGVFEQPFDFARGRAVCSADFDDAADDVVGKGPIDDAGFEQLAVGNDDLVVHAGRDFGAASADLRDGSRIAVELDDVADANGALGEQNQTANEIVDNILAAEAGTDGQCTAKEAKYRHRHVQHVEREHGERGQQHIERNGLQRGDAALAETKSGMELRRHPAADHAGGDVAQAEQNDSAGQSAHGYDRFVWISAGDENGVPNDAEDLSRFG